LHKKRTNLKYTVKIGLDTNPYAQLHILPFIVEQAVAGTTIEFTENVLVESFRDFVSGKWKVVV